MYWYIFAAIAIVLGLYVYNKSAKPRSVTHPGSHDNTHSYKKSEHKHKHSGGHGCC